MNNPLVTVVTITYNLIKAGRADYIRQVIECVQNQSYQYIEHIIIDGASTDGTLDIFKDYPHLKVFSEKDNGVYDAMNKGVAHANGKYIVFLNSDDYWHDCEAVKVSVNALEENNADFSYAPASYIDENGNFLGYIHPKLETFFSLMPFCHQTMFTKTNLVKFDTSFKSAGDYNLIVNLILGGAKGVYVPLNFTNFRYIGISCGKDSSFDNEGGKLSYRECQRVLREALSSRFGITAKDAENLVSSHYIKRDILAKLLPVLDKSLADNIQKYFLAQDGNNISLGRLPKFRKINILFNARDLQDKEAKKWIDFLSSQRDCEISLYKEPDVNVVEEFNHLPVYEGLSCYIDAFCSPVSKVPEKILKANIPVLTEKSKLVFREDYNKNIIVKGSYKYRIGKFVFIKQRISHGYNEFLLFNCIPLLKITECNRCKRFYLFSILKFFEQNN